MWTVIPAQDHRCFVSQFGVRKARRVGHDTADHFQLELNPDMSNLVDEEFKRTGAHRARQVCACVSLCVSVSLDTDVRACVFVTMAPCHRAALPPTARLHGLHSV